MQNNCIYKFDVFFKIYNSIHLKLLKTNKNKCICSFRKTFKINYLKFKSSNNKKKQENPINFSKIISIRNIYSENEDFIDAFCFILSELKTFENIFTIKSTNFAKINLKKRKFKLKIFYFKMIALKDQHANMIKNNI